MTIELFFWLAGSFAVGHLIALLGTLAVLVWWGRR